MVQSRRQASVLGHREFWHPKSIAAFRTAVAIRHDADAVGGTQHEVEPARSRHALGETTYSRLVGITPLANEAKIAGVR